MWGRGREKVTGKRRQVKYFYGFQSREEFRSTEETRRACAGERLENANRLVATSTPSRVFPTRHVLAVIISAPFYSLETTSAAATISIRRF